MKPLLTTTALCAALTAAPMALAQSATDMPRFPAAPGETDIHASDFIGMSVYTAEPNEAGDWNIEEIAGLDSNWDNVGEINDLILTRDGDISAVLVDIGGFLGIGERQVAMNMDEIRFVADLETEEANDFFLVIPATLAEIQDAPEYEGFGMSANVDSAMEGMPQPQPLTEEALIDLASEGLVGTRVYTETGEWVGEISELTTDDAGSVEAAIIDVGGFLGIGEKPVELAIEELDIMWSDETGIASVSVPMTEEELEELPAYES